MRRLIALGVLGLLLAAAVLVLHQSGLEGLAAQEEQLRRELGEQRRAVQEALRQDLDRTLSALLEREAGRPYYHYRHLYLPPDLVANQLALVPSPLAEAPPEPLVGLYLELRGGRFTSPAFLGDGDPAGAEPPTTYAERVRPRLTALAGLAPLLAARLETQAEGPARQELVDPYVCNLNARPQLALQELAQGVGDPSKRSQLDEDWSAYQTRQGKQSGNYAPAASTRTGVPVQVYPFAFVAEPGPDGWPRHLLALRRVAVEGETWLQGFEVDLDHLRQRTLPGLLARLPAPPAEASASPVFVASLPSRREPPRAEVALHPLGAAPPRATGEALPLLAPLDGLAVSYTGAALDPAAALGSSRLLLHGALGLVALVVGLGCAILVGAARGERRLARQRADFVAALTHELKAPLTGMRALSELLHDGVVTDEARRQEYYGSLLSESERLGRLIQNVLDVSRLERGGVLQVAATDLDPGPLVSEVAERFRPRLESEGFALEVDLPQDLPRVHADRESVVQILANLLDNAAKYGRGPQRRVAVSAEPRSSPRGPALTIRVVDAGPGVAPAERARVFERFVRGAGAPREVGGAGLGLAIARSWARAQGGELALAASPAGACFELTLPLAAGAPAS